MNFLVLAAAPFSVVEFNKTLYHGSPTEIKDFKVGQGAGRYGKGLYLTPELSIAQFYAGGGRQGNSGQKVGKDGFIYEFKIQGKALKVLDEEETMSEMCSEDDDADAARSDCGDILMGKVTKFTGKWADVYHGCSIVWFAIKKAKVMDPLNQVLITDQSVIKSHKPYKAKKA